METVAIKLKVKLLVNLASETIFTHKTLLIFNHLSYGGASTRQPRITPASPVYALVILRPHGMCYGVNRAVNQ